ncbi:MAG: cytochrome c, partial [Acidobacteriota bacterium]|nr:cytochrome c [Acidobacteriota bacterium]
DITTAEAQDRMSDGEMFYKITVGKRPMREFESKLSEDELWNVVHFLRTLGAGECVYVGRRWPRRDKGVPPEFCKALLFGTGGIIPTPPWGIQLTFFSWPKYGCDDTLWA